MQELIKESFILQEVLKQGREEGRDEGRVSALQQAVLSLTRTRFPQIQALAETQVARIEQSEVLADLIPKIALAQNAEEALQHLLSAQPPAPSSKPVRRRKRPGHS